MMLQKKIHGIAILMSSMLLSGCVSAASFDCGKASRPIEHAICNDEVASQLDEEMSSLYRESLKVTPNSQAIKKEQRAWLKSRDLCRPDDEWEEPAALYVYTRKVTESECLRHVYEKRIEQLKVRYLRPKNEQHNVVNQMRGMSFEIGERSEINFCNEFLTAVKGGSGISIVPPVVEHVSYKSEKLKPYTEGCHLEDWQHSYASVPRSHMGDRIMAETGQVSTKYDDISVWSLPNGRGGVNTLVFQGPQYHDVALSVPTGTVTGHWNGGPSFELIEQPECKRIGYERVYFNRSQGAPVFQRQGEVVRFQGKHYLITKDDFTSPGNEPLIEFIVDELGGDGMLDMCVYKGSKKGTEGLNFEQSTHG